MANLVRLGAVGAGEVEARVWDLGADEMDPFAGIEDELCGAGAWVGRGGDANTAMCILGYGGDRKRGTREVAREALEALVLVGHDDLFSVHAEARVAPASERLGEVLGEPLGLVEPAEQEILEELMRCTA